MGDFFSALLKERAYVAFSAVGSCHLLDAYAAAYAVVGIADAIVGAGLFLLAWGKVYLCDKAVIPVCADEKIALPTLVGAESVDDE